MFPLSVKADYVVGQRAGVFRSAVRNKKEGLCVPGIGYGPDWDVYFEKGGNAMHVGRFSQLFFCLGCRVSGLDFEEILFFCKFTLKT